MWCDVLIMFLDEFKYSVTWSQALLLVNIFTKRSWASLKWLMLLPAVMSPAIKSHVVLTWPARNWGKRANFWGPVCRFHHTVGFHVWSFRLEVVDLHLLFVTSGQLMSHGHKISTDLAFLVGQWSITFRWQWNMEHSLRKSFCKVIKHTRRVNELSLNEAIYHNSTSANNAFDLIVLFNQGLTGNSNSNLALKEEIEQSHRK